MISLSATISVNKCKQSILLKTHKRIHTNEKQFSQDARMDFTNMLGIGLQSRTNNILFLKRTVQNLTSDFIGLLKNPPMKAELYQVPIFIIQYTFTFSPLLLSRLVILTIMF